MLLLELQQDEVCRKSETEWGLRIKKWPIPGLLTVPQEQVFLMTMMMRIVLLRGAFFWSCWYGNGYNRAVIRNRVKVPWRPLIIIHYFFSWRWQYKMWKPLYIICTDCDRTWGTWGEDTVRSPRVKTRWRTSVWQRPILKLRFSQISHVLNTSTTLSFMMTLIPMIHLNLLLDKSLIILQ